MPWPRFLGYNAAGGVTWATLYGTGAYLLGDQVHRLSGTVGKVLLGLAALVIVAAVVFLRRNERRLEAEAERAIPGPLEPARPPRRRPPRPA